HLHRRRRVCIHADLRVLQGFQNRYRIPDRVAAVDRDRGAYLMDNGYIEEDYIEDYYEDSLMAVSPLPPPPSRSDDPSIFPQKADAFLAALPTFALELEAVALAMNNNSTSSISTTSHT